MHQRGKGWCKKTQTAIGQVRLDRFFEILIGRKRIFRGIGSFCLQPFYRFIIDDGIDASKWGPCSFCAPIFTGRDGVVTIPAHSPLTAFIDADQVCRKTVHPLKYLICGDGGVGSDGIHILQIDPCL
ncbi:hypothetical protein D3C87_1235370 [compost metagenome]